MHNAENKIKQGLFVLLLAALFVPLLQFHVPIIEEKKLEGDFTGKKKPTLNVNNWLNGTFQDSASLWANEHFGFRPDLVRLHNQILYSVSKKVNTKNVIVGKDNYLYELSYINSYLGKDYTGEQHWEEFCRRLKIVQDSLSKRNVFMLVSIAPGKGRYIPEYIPDEYGKPDPQNNYTSFSKQLVHHRINHIDFMDWFLRMKKQTRYPLYTKGGIHWSNYGATLAADSLIRFIKMKGGLNIPQIELKQTKVSGSIQNPDNDIAVSANLLFPYPELQLAYTDIEYETTPGKIKPDMFVVADSYFWQMYWMGVPKNIFARVLVSYYNKQIHDSDKDFNDTRSADEPVDLESNKVILFMVTEANLAGFPWGFLEKLEVQLNIREEISMEQILAVESRMKADPAWMRSIQEKADKNKLSLDSMMRIDAIWMVKQEQK